MKFQPGESRYIEAMFEVLVYVFENYWRGDACPELAHLERKLNAVGFEADEIQEALTWLSDLHLAARGLPTPAGGRPDDKANPAPEPDFLAPSSQSMRVYSALEQSRLSPESMGFITFLEAVGALSPHMRELVIDRAMAATSQQVPLDDLKIIVLMVFWSLGQEPDALILDELCDDTAHRTAH